MPDRKQLQFLENLAAERSDLHAAQLARARQALDAATKQLALLRGYEGGYRAQIGAKLEASVTIESLRGHHRFMQNIGAAVRQQELEVARRTTNAAALERAWQESERRRQGFGVMRAKLVTQEQREQDRQSQRQTDEFASRNLQKSHVGF